MTSKRVDIPNMVISVTRLHLLFKPFCLWASANQKKLVLKGVELEQLVSYRGVAPRFCET